MNFNLTGKKYCKIRPIGSAAFVAAMGDVLDVYHLPYDPKYPVVYIVESSKQLIGEVREPIPGKSEQVRSIDDEYVRNNLTEVEQ